MIPARRFARLLMISDDPCLSRIIERALTEVCSRIRVQAALFHLTDGSAIVLKNKVIIDKDISLNLPILHKVEPTRCAVSGAPVIQSGFKNRIKCPSSEILEAAGIRSHACIQLTLGGTPVAVLSALSRASKQFTLGNLNFMTARGQRLVLTLHHAIHFPELVSDWQAFEQMQAHMHSVSGKNKDIVNEAAPTISLIDKVLKQEGLNRSLTPSDLTRSLPKGINLPTLRLVCDFLEKNPCPVSRKSLANALKFSDITAGHYLTYLVDSGVLRKEVQYGKAGRPPLIYVPMGWRRQHGQTRDDDIEAGQNKPYDFHGAQNRIPSDDN